MLQQLRHTDGSLSIWQPSKLICVAKNYPAHAAEMDSAVPATPTFFIKPNSSLCDFAGPLQLPRDRGDVHHELELAVVIGKRLTRPTDTPVIAGYALAIDLTLRSLQSRLKQAGHPWEASKAFVGSCPIGPILPATALPDPQAADLSFLVNGEMRQAGNTRQMAFPIARLLSEAAEIFTLEAGDVVLTGTPVGVGPLEAGDRYEGRLDQYSLHGEVAA